MSRFQDFALRVNQSVTAFRSGAVSHGAFPWEQSKMTQDDVQREYGTAGIQVLQGFRRASESGVRSLESYRRREIDKLQPLDSHTCRQLNDKIEEGKLTFAAVRQEHGERGLEALESYRQKHYYERGVISGDRFDSAKAQQLDSFRPQDQPPAVVYHHANERDEVRPPAFIDRGDRVEINEAKNREAVAAALKLSSRKWNGQFQVFGTDEYKAMCVQLAAERGYNITNPELQEAVTTAKESLRQLQQEAAGAEPQQLESNSTGPGVHSQSLSRDDAKILLNHLFKAPAGEQLLKNLERGCEPGQTTTENLAGKCSLQVSRDKSDKTYKLTVNTQTKADFDKLMDAAHQSNTKKAPERESTTEQTQHRTRQRSKPADLGR